MDPHRAQPVLTSGAPLDQARAAVVLAHGRGASAESMLEFAQEFGSDDVAYLAPQADASQWYPYRFLEPVERNEPWLTSALDLISSTLERLADAGMGRDRIVLAGFSQGACLLLEFAARHPDAYMGLVGLSGGLIGPPGAPRGYTGSLDPTPVLLGCGDHDPHIPVWRVEETAQVLSGMGARVDTRIYPGMGHTVNPDEIAAIKRLLSPGS